MPVTKVSVWQRSQGNLGKNLHLRATLTRSLRGLLHKVQFLTPKIRFHPFPCSTGVTALTRSAGKSQNLAQMQHDIFICEQHIRKATLRVHLPHYWVRDQTTSTLDTDQSISSVQTDYKQSLQSQITDMNSRRKKKLYCHKASRQLRPLYVQKES